MEHILPIDILLFLTFVAAFALELLRLRCMHTLNLTVSWTGGWRYPYYLPFLAILAGFGPGLAVVLTWLMTRLWISCTSLPSPWSLYISGFFLVGLAGGLSGILYRGFRKIMSMEEASRKLVPLTAAGLICFVVEPLRWILGGSLVLIASNAVGQLVRFTSWEDLVQWIHRPDENQPQARIPVRFFIETEGTLARRGDRIEVQGEEIFSSQENTVTALARRLFDRSRLTEIIAAQEKLRQREDLLAEIPPLIVQNLGKLAARQEALSRSGGPVGENRARLEAEIHTLLDKSLGGRMRSLLYWHYDMPEDEVQVVVNRTPRVDMKPMITLPEYLGLFLSLWSRRIGS